MAARKNFRLSLYPKAFASCLNEASAYASCVALKNDVKKGDCNAEFQQLKSCFQKHMKSLVSKRHA